MHAGSSYSSLMPSMPGCHNASTEALNTCSSCKGTCAGCVLTVGGLRGVNGSTCMRDIHVNACVYLRVCVCVYV